MCLSAACAVSAGDTDCWSARHFVILCGMVEVVVDQQDV